MVLSDVLSVVAAVMVGRFGFNLWRESGGLPRALSGRWPRPGHG
jgi:hypothetical protein